jgi:hypothetical protein
MSPIFVQLFIRKRLEYAISDSTGFHAKRDDISAFIWAFWGFLEKTWRTRRHGVYFATTFSVAPILHCMDVGLGEHERYESAD